jgi:hypothetical protein
MARSSGGDRRDLHAVGLAAHRDTDRVGARLCLPTIADGDRIVLAISGQYAYRLAGIAELRQAAGRDCRWRRYHLPLATPNFPVTRPDA